MNGTISEFDEAKGLGVIIADDDHVFPFHCVEIADGTRAIDTGQPVTFRLLPRFGAFEAGAIEKR